MAETKRLCPVCKKPLTEAEYEKALGLWAEKKEHIKHLEEERRKLQERGRRLADEFRKREAQVRAAAKRQAAEQASAFQMRLKEQKEQLQGRFQAEAKRTIQNGIREGTKKQRDALKEQQSLLSRERREARNANTKVRQYEQRLAAKEKRETQLIQAQQKVMQENQKLREQLKKGSTPQLEGLLEEQTLLAKLRELFPKDKIELTKASRCGDILQTVRERGETVGLIVYECKKVSVFSKSHVDQAARARVERKTDYAVLVTNAFPSKKKHYFVAKDVFVISPISLEPVTYTLRESLVRIALLRLSDAEKNKAVKLVYDYLAGPDYNNKVREMGSCFDELAKELKREVDGHKRAWLHRKDLYIGLYDGIMGIDGRLKALASGRLEGKPQLLLAGPKKALEAIEG